MTTEHIRRNKQIIPCWFTKEEIAKMTNRKTELQELIKLLELEMQKLDSRPRARVFLLIPIAMVFGLTVYYFLPNSNKIYL